MRTILAGLLLAAAANPVRAQMIWGGEYERALRPGAYVPYDAQPYMQRYHFEYGAGIYLNGDSRRLWYLDYLDRADRADKFGYHPPVDPFLFSPHAEVVPAPEGAAAQGAAPAPAETVIEEPRPRFGFGILFGRLRGR